MMALDCCPLHDDSAESESSGGEDEDEDMDDEDSTVISDDALALDCSTLYFLSMMSLVLRDSVRPRLYYTRLSLVGEGSSPWEHMWACGDDRSFIHMLGFSRETFSTILLSFEKVDPEWFRPSPLGGRPRSCDSKTLLAIGLYYVVNRCQQKVCVFLVAVTYAGHATHFWDACCLYVKKHLEKPWIS